MRMPRRDPEADAINRYWNAVNAEPPEETAQLAADMDPSFIETIDRARALHRRRRPRPAFATRLERDLMQAFAANRSGSVPIRPVLPRDQRGRAVSPPPAAHRAPVVGVRVPRPRVLLPVALVLLLLALAGGWALLGTPRPWNSEQPHAVVPAPSTPCGANGADTGAPSGSPVPVSLRLATPSAEGTVAVSFVWATTDIPTGPQSIGFATIDPQCRLWVMDFRSNGFFIFDLDGKLLETWGTPGSGDGQFNFGGNFYFGGIAFAADGGFYVTDIGNHRIEQFDANRQFVRQWSVVGNAAGHTTSPQWIAVGPDGNVYVNADTTSDSIRVYSPDGVLLRTFGGRDGGLLAFDPAGNLWALEPNAPGVQALQQFSPAGAPMTRVDLSPWVGAYAFGFAIDASGRIYIADGNKSQVVVLDTNGQFLFSWGKPDPSDGQFATTSLFSVAVDDAGGIYTVEITPRIQRFEVQFGALTP